MDEGFYRAKRFYHATEVDLITFTDKGHTRRFYNDLVLMHGDLEKVVPRLKSKVPEMV